MTTKKKAAKKKLTKKKTVKCKHKKSSKKKNPLELFDAINFPLVEMELELIRRRHKDLEEVVKILIKNQPKKVKDAVKKHHLGILLLNS